MTVAAAVINYNGGPDLAGCLESLLRQSHRVQEILVVDNRSTDDSVAMLKERFPDIRLVELPRNAGYAGAANVAVRVTRSAYLLLLNPDVRVTPTFVGALATFAEAHPDAGSLTGKLLRPPGPGTDVVIDSTGHVVCRSRWVLNRGEGEADRGQYGMPEEVFGVSGAAPLYRRAMLEDIQVNDEVFAESFFLYLEDVDVDWRARLQGWKAYYVPTAMAYHERGYKGGGRPQYPAVLRHSLKNRYLVMLRNDAAADMVRDAWAIAPMEVLRFLGFLVTAPRALAGYLDVARLLPVTLAQRRTIRGAARVAPAEIRRWLRQHPCGRELLKRARQFLRRSGRP